MLEGISIIIPTYNEEDNIKELVTRIWHSFLNSKIPYELIFIDDNSTDNTVKNISEFGQTLSVTTIIKDDILKRGKAESLLVGFKYAKYNSVCMIDADLQYPPEAILPMYEELEYSDIVVANRKDRGDSNLSRILASKVFRYCFGKVLFNLDCDVQSGLKVFKREILDYVEIVSTPWTFDLQFLHKARNLGYTIGSFDIEFVERHGGYVKLNFIPSVIEIGSQAIKLKATPLSPVGFCDRDQPKMMGNGIFYKGNKFITHNDVNHKHSAVRTVVLYQKIVLIMLLVIIVAGFCLDWRTMAILIVAVLTVVYFIDLLFNLLLIIRSFQKTPDIKISEEEISNLDNKDLPIYTVFCPL